METLKEVRRKIQQNLKGIYATRKDI